MKKIVTVIAFVCAAAAAYAQKTDSLTVIKPEKVIIQSSDSSQVVTVVGKEGNPSYRFTSKLNVADGVSNRVVTEHRGLDFSIFNQALTEKTRETEWCLMGFSELGLGWHAAINGPAEIQKSSRWISEFTWRNALALRYEPKNSPLSFALGIGYARQYYYSAAGTMLAKQDGNVIYTEYPAGSTERSSKLRVNSMLIPLTVYVKVTKNFGFDFGPELIVNTRSRLTSRYYLESAKHKTIYKNLPVRPVSYGLFFSVRLFDVRLYARYQPQNVLKDGRGPQFKSLTIGLMTM